MSTGEWSWHGLPSCRNSRPAQGFVKGPSEDANQPEPDSESAIREAHATGDQATLYHLVHKLAGSSPIVGASALHESAVFLQNFLRLEPRPVNRIDTAVDELLHQIVRFRDAVENQLPE